MNLHHGRQSPLASLPALVANSRIENETAIRLKARRRQGGKAAVARCRETSKGSLDWEPRLGGQPKVHIAATTHVASASGKARAASSYYGLCERVRDTGPARQKHSAPTLVRSWYANFLTGTPSHWSWRACWGLLSCKRGARQARSTTAPSAPYPAASGPSRARGLSTRLSLERRMRKHEPKRPPVVVRGTLPGLGHVLGNTALLGPQARLVGEVLATIRPCHPLRAARGLGAVGAVPGTPHTLKRRPIVRGASAPAPCSSPTAKRAPSGRKRSRRAPCRPPGRTTPPEAPSSASRSTVPSRREPRASSSR